MASLADIRAGLAAAIDSGVDLDMQVSAYIIASPTPPFAQVLPDETTYHEAFQNGAETWGLIVQVIVAFGSDVGAQRQLDELLESSGSLSVKAALEADVRLGGIVSDVTVTRTSGYRTYRLGATQTEALGAEWNVSVLV
jgi:hypothetical protein